jgi:hypothetical protein
VGDANRRRRPTTSVVIAVCPDGCAAPTECDSRPQAFRERLRADLVSAQDAHLAKHALHEPISGPNRAPCGRLTLAAHGLLRRLEGSASSTQVTGLP